MRALALAMTLAAGAAPALAAQDSLPPVAAPLADSVSQAVAPADSVRRPVSPMGAFWRSLLVPGWGQAALDRKLAAALFIGWEGVTLGMALKADQAVGQLGASGAGSLDAKRQEREDWLVLLGFNHLMAALEAYVAAHLWDFPGDLSVRKVPGGFGAAVRLPLPSNP
jgi:hypothetical protein